MNDHDFLAALEDCSLPKELFNHRGHLRAGWLYLDAFPLPVAARKCAESIERFANHLGATGKFHLTLTLAFMHIIDELRHQYPANSWEEFLAACPQLVDNPKALLANHYSALVLASGEARENFVPPDVAPLPGLST